MAGAKAVMSLKDRCISAMVLAGVGDSLGYRCGKWEFLTSGEKIHNELVALGGLSALKNKLPAFRVSDDTVMHMATATALASSSSGSNEDLFDKMAHEYIKCMDDMDQRAPGLTCMGSCHKLEVTRKEQPKAFRIPFNLRGGGCGAAMRAMCIGLRYRQESALEQLIAVSVESGRMTHNHPTGYLGALVAALFTSYAVQSKPPKSWGAELIKSVLPKARQYIQTTGFDVDENFGAWAYFEGHWRQYLELRQISDGNTEPVFPETYGIKERDQFYSSISFSGCGGASGHDSTIIAYDALLGCQGSWEELCNRGVFHGGDSDSTGTIAACWFGAFYGMEGVYECNHKKVEYRDQMVLLAKKLYKLSK